jgi:hypothetical protein
VIGTLANGGVFTFQIEGSQGDNAPINILPIPDSYQGLPESKLDASVLDLAHLYAVFAKGGDNGSYDPPTFTDAVTLHRLINLISNAASAGDRQTVTHW